jgi:hypothetical protein
MFRLPSRRRAGQRSKVMLSRLILCSGWGRGGGGRSRSAWARSLRHKAARRASLFIPRSLDAALSLDGNGWVSIGKRREVFPSVSLRGSSPSAAVRRSRVVRRRPAAQRPAPGNGGRGFRPGTACRGRSVFRAAAAQPEAWLGGRATLASNVVPRGFRPRRVRPSAPGGVIFSVQGRGHLGVQSV